MKYIYVVTLKTAQSKLYKNRRFISWSIKVPGEYTIGYLKAMTSRPFIVEETSHKIIKNTKFSGTMLDTINKAIDIEGWDKLISNSDKIVVHMRLGLHYIGKTKFFDEEATYAKKDYLLNLKTGKFENQKEIVINKVNLFLDKMNVTEGKALSNLSKKWSDRAKNWNEEVSNPESYVNFEDGYKRFNDLLSQFLPLAHKDVLDIGCGTGEVTKILASNSNLNITGIDISEEMIKVAKQNIDSNNVEFEVSNVSDLTRSKRKYDFITSRGILLSHIPNTMIYDYLYDVSLLAKPDAYFIFDFLQNSNVSGKNTFSLFQMDSLMSELGWSRVDNNGSVNNKVVTVAYHKNSKDTVYLATGNPIKIVEMNAAIKDSGKQLSFAKVDVSEIKSDSILEIVKDKCIKSYSILKSPVICTDGGIFIEALNGFPGENSKQAAKKLGVKYLLKLLEGENNRKAVRRNCIGYYNGKDFKYQMAEIECEISEVPKEQFPSYPMDKILIPVNGNPSKRTYSQMNDHERATFTELPQFVDFIKNI